MSSSQTGPSSSRRKYFDKQICRSNCRYIGKQKLKICSVVPTTKNYSHRKFPWQSFCGICIYRAGSYADGGEPFIFPLRLQPRSFVVTVSASSLRRGNEPIQHESSKSPQKKTRLLLFGGSTYCSCWPSQKRSSLLEISIYLYV